MVPQAKPAMAAQRAERTQLPQKFVKHLQGPALAAVRQKTGGLVPLAREKKNA